MIILVNRIEPSKINFKGISTKNPGQRPVTLKDQINQSVEALLKEERIIPEYGDFKPVSESFINPKKEIPVGRVELSVKSIEDKLSPKLRLLRITAFSRNDGNSASALLKLGTKDDILDYLRTDTSKIKIHNFLLQVSKNLN